MNARAPYDPKLGPAVRAELVESGIIRPRKTVNFHELGTP